MVTTQVVSINVFTDADWGGDCQDRKSTTGYVVKINGSTVSWATKKQPTVAISTAEAEYMAISADTQELLWIQQILREMFDIVGMKLHAPYILFCDNQAAISIRKNDVHHHRSKHIDIKYHFIRDQIKNNKIKLQWLSTQDQMADILTKPLDKVKFTRFRNRILQSHQRIQTEC